MKKLIYSFLFALLIVSTLSCEDNENKTPVFTGYWKYEKPYFEFEYLKDSVIIEMYQGKTLAYAAEDIKNMFLNMATAKMGDYFKGIEFKTDGELIIDMQMKNGTTNSLRANYHPSNDVIQVTLNSDDMEELTGQTPEIPPVSFKYIHTARQMTLYFDQSYIQLMYAMMQDKIIPMIISAMEIDFSTFPPERVEQIKTTIEESIKIQITGILSNIKVLKVGFIINNQQ